ncbi:cell division protein FtsQ/DivIB [Flavobacterium gawalongense]|uniref:Cell division protein FtsQ n=1 Tax=Flavobacterium gawalongense TaxID=2594432 RepID=A0A553BP13_9FLAO|nr:cell division protein FtsQ/DivIB [Flavobacterium gawalongense]TRW99942.1 cell division protein FtsQ [Flavobacterium gawalongense]TRX04433.1 cell division protein FtsQ [Flavobacterium gawalongense]TRX08221.1 cell division protein FtsQ [Flavobacterium gawalongense]TRX09986.1 cell division protein FtsQ [Flavobacterium gawalongense]TRX24364.1 cell division protein FtsQ [Flavobacterium gawalongense]
MKLFNWTNIRLLLMFVLVIFLFSFTSNRNKNRKLTKSVVVFVGDNAPFVKQETVNKLLIENKREASSIQKVKLDLNKLERTLNAQEMVEKSDVFVSIDGVLKAVVKQKTPIARVFNEGGSFYIDYEGNRMSLSTNFTARVPLVSGGINKKNNEDLADLFRAIYDDAFLKKNIIGIEIMPNGSLKMLNRNFDYQIDFGRMINVERKFKNYKAFFQKAVLDSSLYKYKKIDLRFTEQVVCTK